MAEAPRMIGGEKREEAGRAKREAERRNTILRGVNEERKLLDVVEE